MTNPGCERFDEISALVAAGAAGPDEERSFLDHLAGGCSACSATYYALTETGRVLAGAFPPLSPPPYIRQRLLEAIQAEKRVAPGKADSHPAAPPQGKGLGWLWAAGWAVAAAMGLMLVVNSDKQTKQAMRYATELDSVRQTLEEKQRTLAETEETLKLVQARQTQLARLVGLTPSPAAAGKVFWNPQANAGILIAFDLPPLPEGKVYQLWAIQGAAPVDAGIFSPGSQGSSLLKVKPLPDPARSVQLFAITIEPAGGSPQPTGEMYLRGAPVSF
jgi:hypothetical protein